MGTILKYGIPYGGGGGSEETAHRTLTQAEYDALSTEEKNNGTIYFISDGIGGANPDASHVVYSNSSSGLSATNVQSAIDEMMAVTAGTLSNPSSLLTVNSSHVERVGRFGVLTVDVRASTDGFPAEAWTTLFTSSIKPTATFSDLRQNATGVITTRIETSGDVRLYAHNVVNKQIVRVIIPFIAA